MDYSKVVEKLFSISTTPSTRSSWHPHHAKTGSASWSSPRGRRGGRQPVFSWSPMRLPAKYASNPSLSADWRLWKQPPRWLFSIWKSQALASAFFKPKWSKKLRNDLLTADYSYPLLHIYQGLLPVPIIGRRCLDDISILSQAMPERWRNPCLWKIFW